MDISEKISYWLDIAAYDLKSARAMHESRRYLYTVYLCQQALEKMLKALYLNKFNKEAPWSHNLVFLRDQLGLQLADQHSVLLAELTTYYIEGRYPSYKQKLSGLVRGKKSAALLKQSEELYSWLRRKVK